MITRRTVLVLGAGASKPYGLPVGTELRRLILDMADGELDRIPSGPGQAMITHGQGERFKTAFRRSQFESIDAFLARRPELAQVGKHAIASQLLQKENAQRLLDGDPEDHWYRYLLHAMDAPWEEFAENNLSVVTFNYDRSLECILEAALAAQHNKSNEETRAMVERFQIVHVYGALGSLNPSANDFVPYGGGTNCNEYLYRAAAGLLVIPEGRNESPAFERARALISEAEALCFLGFGFDRTNVSRLGGVEIGAGGQFCEPQGLRSSAFAATVLGLTNAEIEDVGNRIANERARPAVMAGMRGIQNLRLLRESLILGGG